MRTSRLAQYAVNVCLPCSRHASTVPLLATRRIPLFTNLRISRRSITWASTPRQFPTSGFHSINPSEDIEEETLSTYEAEKYYPVQQGEVLGDRYQTLAKLGYGVTSTVWFARDLVDSKYVILKVYVAGQETNHEVEIYERINTVPTTHPGKRFIRQLFDHFSIEGPHGRHTCLIHEPLGMNTDLQLKNLLLPSPDESALSRFEEDAVKTPAARKMLKGRTIYTSSKFPLSNGLPLLSDFGEARFAGKENNEDIMPNVYRAPEVISKMNWDHTVEIWSVAMLAWDIVSPRTLLDGENPDGIFDDRVHVAELIALLGPPPPQFREMGKLTSVFWDESGNWKELAPLPNITLEGLAADIRGDDKEGFLRWLRAALQWNPQDRPTALELLYDEWLMKGLKLKSREETSEDSTTHD
ncbi:uncharacterized protein TRUGW13939_09935 [Talaromyces rugulosus]|uniref:non-specific serine/threonine protein kinase n=1 Tax=Talaromyces rugulosus TaxID=121627 RepID=A0A7H8R8P5_TALRU|nr:uncharacterized protein TRUGW13939_09935 [Talaromyces rugulosus]QKX62770.1 hypothetical protein TRUGW13939_09935 [Talaromyces rugulosus]